MQDYFVFQTVSVIGLGYIGLPTAAVFAASNINVIGVDVNRHAVDTINRGEIHIIEPDLDGVVRDAVLNGKLRAQPIAEPADAFIIAVPTPFTGDDHAGDISYIKAASLGVAPVLKPGDLVILESTSPVGTTEQMAKWLAEVRPDLSFPHQAGQASDIRIAHCPERVLPGRIMKELVSNDRIIGGMTPLCAKAACALYRIFVEGECIETDVRTAEMCKLAENAFRDVNIAFANELSMICDRLAIDVWQLIRLANRHPRVDILQPGAGVGGHCIAVDPWFIVSTAPDLAHLLRSSRQVNDAKPDWVLAQVRKAAEHFSARHQGRQPIIAVLGLAFKPDIDDLRESPALRIAETLYAEHGDQLIVVEPHITELPFHLHGCVMAELPDAVEKADILVVLVKHRSFAALAGRMIRPDQEIIDIVGLGAGVVNKPSRSSKFLPSACG